MSLHVEVLWGSAVAPWIPELARLGMAVFREHERVVGPQQPCPSPRPSWSSKSPLLELDSTLRTGITLGSRCWSLPTGAGGWGWRFFQHLEARTLGCRMLTFCAVERPAEHSLKPADYVPLNAFWQRRGFSKRPELVCRFSWQDLSLPQPSAKPMVFWVKEL